MLPEGQYLQIETDIPVRCLECDLDEHHLAVSNEIVFDDQSGGLVGIDAVVRFVECGHRVPGASADELSVARMLNEHESMTDDY